MNNSGKVSETEKVKALLVIVTGMVVLYLIFKSLWFIYIAAGVGVLGLAIPIAGDWIVKGWFKIAEILGAINGRILLSVIFFIILTPIAFLAKLSKKNLLGLGREKGGSVYTVRNHKYTPADLKNVW